MLLNCLLNDFKLAEIFTLYLLIFNVAELFFGPAYWMTLLINLCTTCIIFNLLAELSTEWLLSKLMSFSTGWLLICMFDLNLASYEWMFYKGDCSIRVSWSCTGYT